MKVILLLCLLSFVAGQSYFALRVQDGRAISLGNGGTHAYLKLVPYDPLDTHQHFTFERRIGYVGILVVSRPFPYLVFDITGGTLERGARLAAWERKGGADPGFNQRFLFDETGHLTPAEGYDSDYVDGTLEGQVVLAGRSQSTLGLVQTAAPTLHTVRVIGNSETINITFTNSHRTPNWIIPANSPFSEKQIFSGTILSAANSAGVILEPSPFIVTKNTTISFYLSTSTEEPTPAPTTGPFAICGDVEMGGRIWHLANVPTFEAYGNGVEYLVNFCGVPSPNCYSNVACFGTRRLGQVYGASVTSFADGQITILANNGEDDIDCPYPISSELIINCKTDNSTTIESSGYGMCHYYFTVGLPKIYCEATEHF